MTKGSFRGTFTLGVLILLLLAGCANEPDQEAITQASPTIATAAPTETPLPSPTPTLVPSPTPQPTLEPTIAPSPTPEIAPGEHLEKGIELYEGGDYNEAIAAFDQAIAAEPWSMTEAFAYRHAARGDSVLLQPIHELDSQISDLDRLIAENSEDANAYFERGQAKYTRALISGEPVDRRDLFADADAENVNVMGGTITVDSLNLENAIADLDQAIAINPEFAAAYHLRGLAHHLQALGYIGIAPTDYKPEEIESAIDDYDQAISFDPELTDAYHDRATALTHRAWIDRHETDVEFQKVRQDFEEARLDFTVAIEQRPEAPETYLNRAFMLMLFASRLESAGEDSKEVARQWLDDAARVIELDSENPWWGHLLHSFALSHLRDLGEDVSLASQPEQPADEDFENWFYEIQMQYELADIFARIPTLSQGPPIIPLPAKSLELSGQISDGLYTSPGSNMNLKIPPLMEPNAIIWDEPAAGGELFVYFEDDLGRWFSMMVIPGSLEGMPVAEWVHESVSQYLDVDEEFVKDTSYGPAVFVEYRNLQPEAACASAYLHHEDHFYRAEYCLADHYMGEDDDSGGIRLFATPYGIEFEPVVEILDQFLEGLEILDT